MNTLRFARMAAGGAVAFGAMAASIVMAITAGAGAQPAAAPGTPVPPAPPTAENPAPRIMSPAPEFNYGSMDADTKIEHEFIVKNVGNAPLEIAGVKTSCGCTVAELKTKTLQPGEETAIAATLSNKGRQGQQTRHLTVESNDPIQPLYRLTLTGVAVASVNVEPKMVNFGRIVDDVPRTQSVKVSIDKKKQPVKITAVNSTEPGITAEVKTLQEGAEYEVVISTAPNLAPKNYSSRISITTDSKDAPTIVVPASAQVVGDLEIRPPQVQVAKSEQAGETTSQYIQVAAGRVSQFEVTAAEVPGTNVEVLIQERAKNNYLIRLSNMLMDGSLAGKELVLKTTLEDRPEIRVPIVVSEVRRNPGAPVSPRVVQRGAARVQ